MKRLIYLALISITLGITITICETLASHYLIISTDAVTLGTFLDSFVFTMPKFFEFLLIAVSSFLIFLGLDFVLTDDLIPPKKEKDDKSEEK